MRRLVLAVALALAPLASATTIVRLAFDELAHASQVIVHGTVTRVEVVAVGGDERRLRTQVDIAVAETLAGAPRQLLRLDLVGGRRGKWALTIPGMPSFTPGEEVVLFLEDLGPRPPSTAPRYALTGLGQAKFTVTTSGGVRRVTRSLGGAHLVSRPGSPDVHRSETPEAPETLDELLGAVRALKGGHQ